MHVQYMDFTKNQEAFPQPHHRNHSQSQGLAQVPRTRIGPWLTGTGSLNSPASHLADKHLWAVKRREAGTY